MKAKTDQVLDVRGEICPMPVILTRRALEAMESGYTIRVEASDPGSIPDLAAFARSTGQKLLHQEELQGVFITLLEKV